MQSGQAALVLRLRPYESLIMTGYSALLWESPIILCLILLGMDGLLSFAYATSMGFIAVLFLIFLIAYSLVVLNKWTPIVRFFKPAERPDEEKYQYICGILAQLLVKVGMVSEYLRGTQFESEIPRIGYVSAVWLTLAFAFNIMGRLWVFAEIANLSILAPGFVVNFLKSRAAKEHAD